jgi:hypothetical protein
MTLLLLFTIHQTVNLDGFSNPSFGLEMVDCGSDQGRNGLKPEA